jgi:hypothetical protein
MSHTVIFTPLCPPRKQGKGQTGERLPERGHPFDGAQGKPGDEEDGD